MNFFKNRWGEILAGILIAFVSWTAGHFSANTQSAMDQYVRNQIAEQLKTDPAFRITIAEIITETTEIEKKGLADVRKEISQSGFSGQLRRLQDDIGVILNELDLSKKHFDNMCKNVAFESDDKRRYDNHWTEFKKKLENLRSGKAIE